jgi:zinc transport system ATP-binding protein
VLDAERPSRIERRLSRTGDHDLQQNPAILCEDLSYSYNRHPAVEKANVTVNEQDFVSIVGPNGGGKTTLLKLMLGLLHPSSGRVRIFGKQPEEARPRIGYMPQHAHLDPQFPVSVMDVVLMGRIGHTRRFGPYTRMDREFAEEALKELHMWEHRRAHFSELSGGQRQRVLIARALACQPDLLLLDEPTASLDLAGETELYELLRSFTERLTVVVVSHDIGFVSHYVTKVICVKRNVVVHPTSEITGEFINELYGSPMHLVRHNHFQ